MYEHCLACRVRGLSWPGPTAPSLQFLELAGGLASLTEAVEILGHCVALSEGFPMVLENPVGQIHQFWRDPDLYVHPWEFAHWATVPERDAYTKKTGLWLEGGACAPLKNPWTGEVDKNRIHNSPDSKDRARRRSQTPEGLARAIFLSNKHLLAK